MPYRTFADARNALVRDETSCESLVSSFLDRIDADNERLNVFTFVDREGALERARELDRQRPNRDPLPLEGLVIAVKDVICQRDRPTTCGSRILQGFRSLYDATVVARLVDAGAIIIGRTNCDEFAMGSSNENSYYGPVRNPVNDALVPGGSSGGSAAAVAAGMCHAALGSDTGGSIRQPAAFCGTVGLKPTYGRVSRFGLVAFASSFDCIGPFANSVHDLARVLSVIAGADPNDSTSAPVDVADYEASLTGDLSGIRIGLPTEYLAEGLDPEIKQILLQRADQLRDAGAEIREVSLPHTRYGIATYYILCTAEASSNLARYDGVRYGYRADLKAARREGQAVQESALRRQYTQSRTEGFGQEVKRRIMLGTYVLSSGYYDAYYAKAQRVRSLIRQDFDR
ncbi:MAG TPA: Asp-tRNA(Asn)/Glu-tRNA(Gln) amidotransferase subunit GatA, partial [Rhodothermales bacterium]